MGLAFRISSPTRNLPSRAHLHYFAMLPRLSLFLFLACSWSALAGVGENKEQIRARYRNITFSARETQPRGPVHEEYDYLGRRVEVHYENHLSATEIFHGINSTADAHRLLGLTQTDSNWRIAKHDDKIVEWRSGALLAQLENGILRVSAAKERKPH